MTDKSSFSLCIDNKIAQNKKKNDVLLVYCRMRRYGGVPTRLVWATFRGFMALPASDLGVGKSREEKTYTQTK